MRRIFDCAASYHVSCVLFLLLFVLTYLGTLHQVEHGLYETQRTYFASAVVVHRAFGVFPIPLPGAYLVLGALFVNLLLGAIVRARKGWAAAGILTAHAGILLLLAGAFVSHEFAHGGHMTLYEGETATEFESGDEWEIGVAEKRDAAETTEFIVRQEDFDDLGGGNSRTFLFPGAPFELTVSGFVENAERFSEAHATKETVKIARGYYLRPLPPEGDVERNRAGAYVTLRETPDGGVQEGVLWAGARSPLVLDAAGKSWTFDLRRRRWPLPFAITLNRFVWELHPRSNTPKEFRSEVTRTHGETSQDARITMNEPLRYAGFALYQSSWGPEGAGPEDRLYSTLAVVKNPAEQFPLYACILVTLGLTLHFSRKLARYLKAERMQRP